jgi:hypothetical protein
MPLPTKAMVHVDPVLTNIASNWIIGASLGGKFFAGERLFPLVQTSEISANIFQYDRKDMFRVHDVRPRTPATESEGGGYRVSLGAHYQCHQWAFHKDIGDEEPAYATLPINMDRDATSFVTQLMMLKRDYLIAQAAFRVGLWGTDVTGVNAPTNYGANLVRRWQDYLTPSAPQLDVDYYRQWISLASGGFKPNKLACGINVWNVLKNHPSIIARYVFTQAGGVPQATPQMVADYLELDEIIVLETVANYGPEGGQWVGQGIFPTNDALLYFTPSSPSLSVPSAGYTFGWTGASNQGTSVVIERFRLANDAKGDRITGSFHMDTQIVENILGVYMAGLTTGALTQVVLP